MTHNSPSDFDSLANSGSGSPVPSAPEVIGSGANRAQRAALEHQGLSGARWFYWVAILSLVNSLVQLAGGANIQFEISFEFIFGLGTTQLVDRITAAMAQKKPEQLAMALRGTGLTIDVILAGFVAAFGWFSTRRSTNAFGIGIFLYLLDGLLFVIFRDWYGFGFHMFALCCMWSGFSAYRKLNALEAESVWNDDPQLAPAVD